MNASDLIHPFEKAGLGIAPFKFIGVTKNIFVSGCGTHSQPGGTCDYCANGIMYEYWIRDANGKKFKVGCDCVERLTGKLKKRGETDPLKIEIENARLKLQREVRHEREAKKIAELLAAVEPYRELMATMPHSKKWAADKGQTRLDELNWYMDHAGNKCKIEELKHTLRIMQGLASPSITG